MDGFVESMQKSGQSLEILYHPILNAATAILLHNFYKDAMQKPPFSLGQLSAKMHPMGYMLILCDELKEWNREAYGVLDKQKVLVADSDIIVTADILSIHSITFEKTLSLEYPNWYELTDSLKYSNIREARTYFEKLAKIRCVALANDNGREEMQEFTYEQIEMLARDEHNSWYDERKQNGWVYGDEKDSVKKISPYMIPYDKLTEKIKELDRDAVRNIFPLLKNIKLKIYKA